MLSCYLRLFKSRLSQKHWFSAATKDVHPRWGPTSRTAFQPQNPKAIFPLLFLFLRKNVNKLPPYVSEGAPRERGQEGYTADRTQTLTSSNIASSVLWCGPYAHLAPAAICWQYSNISPARLFIFSGHMLFGIWHEEVTGVWSRWGAITSEATCQRIQGRVCVSSGPQMIR